MSVASVGVRISDDFDELPLFETPPLNGPTAVSVFEMRQGEGFEVQRLRASRVDENVGEYMDVFETRQGVWSIKVAGPASR